MKPVAEIFSQGEEVVTGQIADSNAAWLSGQLADLGFAVRRHTAVGDCLEDLVTLIQEIAGRADCCLCTGGLGPTTDDLTAEAVSVASGLPLRLDEPALQQIRQFFASRKRAMPEANCKQAWLPETALRIDNALGTAPGFALRIRRCWFVFLPGVPAEMKAMFSLAVRGQLLQRFNLQPDCLVTLRSVGIGESAIQQCLEGLELPPAVQLGYRAAVDEVQTKLLFPAGFCEREKRVCVERAAGLIGDYVFAIDGLDGPQGNLVDVVGGLMQDQHLTLAVLETFSQGLFAAKCIGRGWLHAAEINLDFSRVAQEENSGADQWAARARISAEQLKSRRQTDLALVQLAAGEPFKGNGKDTAIVLYNALVTPQGVVSTQLNAFGALHNQQNQAALLSLDLLRRYLQDKCH